MPTLLTLLASPFILVARAFHIYFLGCLGVYAERLARGVLCGLCVCCGCTYRDKQFPSNASSIGPGIGPWKGKKAEQIEKEIEWRRLSEVCAISSKSGAKLFSGKIEPADICQGQLGNCWLMAACACLANTEGAIQNVFKTKEYNAMGKYTLSLFDRPGNKWVTVQVDDW